jgi:hypothetical protein
MVPVVLLATETVSAQVTVAPTMLFIDSKKGIGNLFVTNNSASSQEVSISFAFGYPCSDSAGNAIMRYDDTAAAETFALNPYVKAYPRKFFLGSREEQTVRLQVRVKKAAKNAFYFTRIKVTSNQKTPDVEKTIGDSISTRINFKFDQILPVFYRRGKVSTGLTIHDISTTSGDGKLTVLADVERTGGAPFIGSMRAELFSPGKKRVALFETTAAVYFRTKNRFELDISKAGKGGHRLALAFETKRGDVSKKNLLQTEPVTKEVKVILE